MHETVASAIDRREPRLHANGVPPAGFARVSASVRRWSGWCADRPPWHRRLTAEWRDGHLGDPAPGLDESRA